MTLKIEGMGCMHCVAKVTTALKEIGAEIETVEIGSAKIAPYEDTERLQKAIEDAGFALTAVE